MEIKKTSRKSFAAKVEYYFIPVSFFLRPYGVRNAVERGYNDIVLHDTPYIASD
jgi:hypothetical protein